MATNRNNSSKRLKEADDPDNTQAFTPREYQIEILEQAKKENTIACLGTGTGKTFIAVMLIRENANEVRKPFEKDGKRIFFLVPTVPLVIQQGKTIEDHTDLKVGQYCGEMDVDSWNKEEWEEQFSTYEVLVMTAEIFRIIVDHAFIPLTKIKLLIIDECHRAQGDHPYRQALKKFLSLKPNEMPRIFGLSASLLNGKCKPTKLEKNLSDLEKTLMSKIITASDIMDLQKYGTDPNEFVVLYRRYENSAVELIKETQVLVNAMKEKKEESEKKKARSAENSFALHYDDIVFFDKPIKALGALISMLESMGPWCARKAADMYVREIESLLQRSLAERHVVMLNEIKVYLQYFIQTCDMLNGGVNGIRINAMPHRLKRLLDIINSAKHSPLFQEDPINFDADINFSEDPVAFNEMYKRTQSIENVNLCSIIFVEQRITAFVLNEWLKEIKKVRKSEFDFLNPEFIVGHGMGGGLSETGMSQKVQRKKLKDFRDKKCNLLIATQVLEEGMDIRQCNLVIRFDLPMDFRSYVQSKGRARAKNSIYVLLIEVGEKYKKFLPDLANFKTIEEMLMSKCHNRNTPTEEEIAVHMSDAEIPPYMPYGPNGPCITMYAAISLINRYCSSLPSDMATKLTPQWTLTEVDPDVTIKEYVCSLRMPINSPIREKIVGEAMKRKKLAKMSAALKACELLNKKGELNKNLVPISCLVDDAIEEELGELEEEDGNVAVGTNRRRQVYEKKVPVFLKNIKPEPRQACFLHIFKMDLEIPLPDCLNPRQRPIVNPNDSPRGLALLSTKMLPPVNSFPIFNKSGKIHVTIEADRSPITLTEEDIQKIEIFHQFIFSDTLWIEDNKVFCPSSSKATFYIVPINKGQSCQYNIDWNFIDSTQSHPYNLQKLNNFTFVEKTVYSEDKFIDAVLMRSYKVNDWQIERPTFHHVVKILKELSPTSIFVDPAYKTYKDYFRIKWRMSIENDNQPLVETVQSGGSHMWKPIYLTPKETFEDKANLSKSKIRHRNYREYLVPELSIIHPFPSSFFNKVLCLPTMLFRLNALLLGEEIRQAVAREAFIGKAIVEFSWPKFCLETSDKILMEYLYKTGKLKKGRSESPLIPCDITKDNKGNITSFEVDIDLENHIGPSPCLLLQALTAKSCGDEFDLERLEMIGDSFLKYAMSVKTYMKYTNFNEGRLTLLRSSLIQNKLLYYKAKKKNLGQYLTTASFNCKMTWLPPCYVTEDKIDTERLIKKTKKQHSREKEKDSENPLHLYFTKQVISDKCIADSVEALIGSYLLSCGQQGALRFLVWFGLNPFEKKNLVSADFKNWPPPPPNPIVGEVSNVNQRLAHLTDGFDHFERIINYKFKNRAYLLQAFTHPSYSYNDLTDCYQRLEFLGDAVLDYLITRQLYEDPSGHSPGMLTDLRSALVNNIYFASLAVQHKYHKFLKMLSPHLLRLITEFLNTLQDSKSFQFFETHGYYLEELECFELQEVEVPKALGDIFESVAGAVYLDSGMSLNTVWRVFYPMIEPAMKHLCKHVPKSPVRELYELVKTTHIFGEHIEKGGKTYIEISLADGRKFHGVGPNKKVAKRSAAKRALAVLKGYEQMEVE